MPRPARQFEGERRLGTGHGRGARRERVSSSRVPAGTAPRSRRVSFRRVSLRRAPATLGAPGPAPRCPPAGRNAAPLFLKPTGIYKNREETRLKPNPRKRRPFRSPPPAPPPCAAVWPPARPGRGPCAGTAGCGTPAPRTAAAPAAVCRRERGRLPQSCWPGCALEASGLPRAPGRRSLGL